MGAAAAITGGLGLLGTVTQIAGQRKAAKAESRAQEANARFLQEQAEFAAFSAQREESIFKRESAEAISNQITGLANTGFGLSGNSYLKIVESEVRRQGEVEAIRKEGSFRVRLASLRATSAETAARDVRRIIGLQTAGTLLGGISQAAGIFVDRPGRKEK